ncbi:MAG: hypothetical protein ACE5HQ_11195, partial [Gemmatimonadota bacterium]
ARVGIADPGLFASHRRRTRPRRWEVASDDEPPAMSLSMAPVPHVGPPDPHVGSPDPHVGSPDPHVGSPDPNHPSSLQAVADAVARLVADSHLALSRRAGSPGRRRTLRLQRRTEDSGECRAQQGHSPSCHVTPPIFVI